MVALFATFGVLAFLESASAASPPSIVSQPSASTICVGTNTSFTVTASNATAYQWQVDKGSGFGNITNGMPYSGATTETLTITGASAALNGSVYRAVATGAASPDAESNGALLVVHSAPNVTWQPSNATIFVGDNTTFGAIVASATGYQWQVDQGSGFSSITNHPPYYGATTSTLTIMGATAAMDGYRYRVIATGACTPVTASNSATLTVIAPPVANAVSATVAANSSENAVALNITGGTANGVSIGANAGHGTAIASGTTITYTPTAGYSGTDSFTYTASNDAGTSTPATVSITVTPPTLVMTPASLPNTSAGSAYSQALSASGGTAPYTFDIIMGALPPGMTIDQATNTVTGTPTATGTFNTTIRARDTYGATGSTAYSVTVVCGNITFTPPHGTTLNGTTGVPFSQTFSTSDGMSGGFTGSGTEIQGLSFDTATRTYGGIPTRPDAQWFTVDYTDRYGCPYMASYVVTISHPTITMSPTGGALADAVTGVAYSQTISASGGSTPYRYTVASGSLPAGMALDETTGAITGTATSTGTANFRITATDAYGAAAEEGYTLTVKHPTITLTPAAGALSGGTVGVSYEETISPSGGAAPYTFAVTAGALPSGTTLDTTTGKISGTPTATGTQNFTITATDTYGASASAAYVVTVVFSPLSFNPASGTALKQAMVGEAYSQSISATGGTAPLIYSLASGALPDGMILNVSTGELTGPLQATAVVQNYSFAIKVTDANHATAMANYTLEVVARAVTVIDKAINVPAGGAPANVNLEAGATGGPFSAADLTFVEPSNAGTASIVRGEFAAAGPTPLGWYLKFIPNPAFSGTVRVGFKLTGVLGTSNTAVVTYGLSYDPAQVAADINDLVHGFVQTRQNLISSSIKVPGLLERRQMENATDPVTARMTPSETGMTASFSTSLAQLESARDSADGVSGGYASPFDIWIDGMFMMHNREENDNRWGSFGIINLGADYLLADKALVGLSFHFDRMTDPTKDGAELTGNGWLAGPYASLEIGKGVFWDTSLLYGGSANDIDTAFWDGAFDTTRWMIDTSVKGEWLLDEATTLTPKLRVVYFSETVDDYAVTNDAGDELGIEGFDEEQFRVSLGAEIARSFVLENDLVLTPKLGVTGGFSGLDGAGAFGSISAGLSLQTRNALMIDAGLLFNIEGDGQASVGAKAGVSSSF